VREKAGGLQWCVSTKVSGELYRRLLDLAEARGLDLGELVCSLICFGLEGFEFSDRSFMPKRGPRPVRSSN
jgi:hypothetical protein